MANHKNFANLALLAVFTQYLQFLPIRIETQPLLALLLILFNYKFFITNFKIVNICYIFILSFLGTIFGFLNGISFELIILTELKYLLPFLFFVLLFKYDELPSESFLNYSILFFWCLVLLYFSGYEHLLEPYFQRFTLSQYSRGFSFITPEQSYAAMFLCPLYILNKCYTSKTSFFRSYSIIFFILLTKSGIGFVLIALLLLLDASFLGLIFLLVVLFSSLILFGDNSRLSDIFIILNNINYNNFIIELIVNEPSGTNRLLVNLLSIFAGFSSIFGYGFGSFQSLFPAYLVNNFSELILHHEVLSVLLVNFQEVQPQSFMASFLFECGLIGIPGIYILFNKMLPSNVSCNLPLLISSLLFFVFFFYQGQITSPTQPLLIFSLYKFLSIHHSKK